ncbi:MAG: DUF362 domain-containing protein [Verrucomicrobia bacterium]|nr:DUF362 domain-containing protein [Verrucomicrobiota bacterium]
MLAVFLLWVLGFHQPVARAADPLLGGERGPRAYVVTTQDPAATDAFRPRLERIRAMVDRALTNLTAKATLPQAWRSLVTTQDVVGIKVYSAPGPNSGTRAAVVAAVVEGLLAAGLPPTNIIVWDRQITDLRLAGFSDLVERYGIRLAGSAQAGWDEKVFFEPDSPLIGNLVWGDLEFGQKGDRVGRKSFVSKLLTHDITKTINVTPLLNNNEVGVSGNLYSLATGSVDNLIRFESSPDMAKRLAEIYNLPELNDKVVLSITDALICQYEGGERGLLHYSATLNELRFSRDPVALDVLSIQELDHQRELAHAPTVKPNLTLYNFAAVVQLGVDDLKRIQVVTLH